MKKILVLATLILLVAGGLFAQVTVSGDVQYGASSDFDAALGTERLWSTVVVTGKVGDYNTAKVRFLAHSNAVDTWVLTTDMAGALGLDGLKWTMATGREWYATASPVSMAAYNVGRGAVRFDARANWLSWNEMRLADMVNVKLGYTNTNAPIAGQVMGGLDMTFDPVMVAVNFNFPNIDDFEAANTAVSFGVKADVPMDGMALAVGAGFKYQLADAAPYQIGAGLEFKYDTLATVNVGYWGIEESVLNRMSARLRVVPMAGLTLDVGAVLNMDEDVYGADSMINDLDIAVEKKIGAATYRVGYLMASEGAAASVISGDLGIPGRAGTTGGAYFVAKLSY